MFYHLFDHPRRDAEYRYGEHGVLRVEHKRYWTNLDVLENYHEKQIDKGHGEGRREVRQEHQAVRRAEQSEQFGELGVQQPDALHEHGHLRNGPPAPRIRQPG